MMELETDFDKQPLEDGFDYYLGQTVYYEGKEYEIISCILYDGARFYDLVDGIQENYLHNVKEKDITMQPSLF